jgi:hypothetical protein
LTVLTIAVLAFAQAAHAQGNDDHSDHSNHSGNPGSVKVDDDDIDDAPANHPHVVCGLFIVVEHGFGRPFDIDFDAQAPTTKAGADQRLLIVHVPDGDNVSGLIDLRGFLAGIAPNPQQGFHVLVTAHLPGGDEHKVIWVLKNCPPGVTTTTTPGATTTTAKSGTTTTTAKSTATTTAQSASTTSTVVGGAVNNGAVPTQVLGENFVKNPATDAAAATSLANTGNPFSPALAVGLVLGGLGVLGAARRASGRRLEATMRRSADRER